MTQDLENILQSIETLTMDNPNGFGERIVHIIRKTEELQAPENNYQHLREYLEDFIQSQTVGNAHLKKFPSVYHENTHISGAYEIAVAEKILESLPI